MKVFTIIMLMQKSQNTEFKEETLERMCAKIGIHKDTIYEYLLDELNQIYILSQLLNPQFLKTNADSFQDNLHLFKQSAKLHEWQETYARKLRYKGEPVDACSTEKWKSEIFTENKIQKCTYCKTDVSKENCEVDHFIPRDCHGIDRRSNFRVSCNPCNNGKRQLSSSFLFNCFSFSNLFSEVAYTGKMRLSKKERFQILQWSKFKCTKCLSENLKIRVYFLKEPYKGGSAVFGNSIVLCDQCGLNLKEMEISE